MKTEEWDMNEWEQSFVKLKYEMIQQIQSYSSIQLCGDQVRLVDCR